MKTRALMLIIGLMLGSQAHAALFKCKQPDGSIAYTDQPCATGEELKLPGLTTYTPTPVPQSLFQKTTPNAPDDKSETYNSLTIITPKNGDRIEATGSGNVDIVVRPDPALRTVKGHVFAIVLDGKQLPTTGVTNTIRLNNVDRGTHSAQILILSKSNALIQASNTVSFTIGRPTVYTRQQSQQTTTDAFGNPQTTLGPATQPAVPATGATRAPRSP